MEIWPTVERRRKDPGRENETKTQATNTHQERVDIQVQGNTIEETYHTRMLMLRKQCADERQERELVERDAAEAKAKAKAEATAKAKERERQMPTTNPPTITAVKAAANMPTFGLIVCRRRFPDPKYCKSIQLDGELTFRPFALTANRPTARASTPCPTSTSAMAMAMLSKAKLKNPSEVDSDFVSKTATVFTTAPTNQQDSTAVKFCSVPSSVQNFSHSIFDKANQALFTYEPTGPTENNFNTDRTLGATLRAEHYAAFRRPPPTYDKALHCRNPTDEFKTDRTLGATLRADH